MEPRVKEVEVTFVRKYSQTEHVCPVCGTGFTAPRLRVYCSLPCKQKAAWERNGEKWNEERKEKRKKKWEDHSQ